MTRVADSSFLIARWDGKHPEGRRRGSGRTRNPSASPEVRSESPGVVHARVGMAAATTIWRELNQLANLEIQETTDVERIAERLVGGKGKLSWVDAAVLATCGAEGARPLCFDEDIERAVGRR